MIEILTAVYLELVPPKAPPVPYYGSGKSCYIQGEYHKECPQ